MSCGVGHRHGSDLMLLWLWCRPTAIALTGPLAWEPPYAVSAALKRQKQKQKKIGRSCHGSAVMNWTSIHEDLGSILDIVHWAKDLALL